MKKNLMKHKIIRPDCHEDSRGSLVKIMTKKILRDFGIQFGEIYFISFSEPDVMRGSHVHHETHEFFCVINGECNVRLKDSDETCDVKLSSSNPKVLYVPPFIGHQFVSVSDETIVLAVSSMEYDKDNDDTYPLLF